MGKEVHHQIHRNKTWSSIWNSRVIPEVKMFAWRMIQWILPTGSTLQSRGCRWIVGVQCVAVLETLQDTYSSIAV